MEKFALTLFLLLSSVVLSSCGKAEVYLHVLRGNYAYGRGDFQEATVMYLKASDTGQFRDIVAYNMGNVYQALGESEAALEQWEKARLTGNKELLPNVLYNEGILKYEMGEYEQSYLLFRQVLELDPLRDDARVNLEYALKKMSARNKVPKSIRPVPGEEKERENLERVLQYVERKEQTLWGTGTSESEYQRDW